MSDRSIIGELIESKDIVWQIPNFSTLFSGDYPDCYHSPSFTFANTIWSLSICQDTNSHKIFLNGNPNSAIYCELSIVKADRSFYGTIRFNVLTTGVFCYINWSNLQQRISEFLPLDILTVICILEPPSKAYQEQERKIAEHMKEENRRKAVENLKCDGLAELSENFRILFTDKDSCDTIVKVKDKEFQVHKIVLMARSTVFAAMFRHDTLEKRTGIVNITDCDPDSFDDFLEFIYCGKLENISLRKIFHLYNFSDKYDIQRLKSFCIDFMEHTLSADSVCDIVQFADKYDIKKIMDTAQDFFTKYIQKIVETTYWESLMENNYRLANRLIKGMFSKVRTSD